MAKHVVKLRNLGLATLRSRRLLKIAVAPHIFNDAFAIKLFLQSTQCTFYRLALPDFYFDCHLFSEKNAYEDAYFPLRQLFSDTLLHIEA